VADINSTSVQQAGATKVARNALPTDAARSRLLRLTAAVALLEANTRLR